MLGLLLKGGVWGGAIGRDASVRMSLRCCVGPPGSAKAGPHATASSPESVEKSFYAVGGLVFQDFDAAFHLWGASKPLALADRWDGGARGGCAHVDFGRLGEGPDRMDVVVEDDDPDHDPQAERHRLLAGESAAVLPGGGGGAELRQGGEGGEREGVSAVLTAFPA